MLKRMYKNRREYLDHSNHCYHCLIPCSIALHLVLVRSLSNTRLYKAIGACTIVLVYDTDLQRGRAMTSLFRDVTTDAFPSCKANHASFLLSIALLATCTCIVL